MKNKTRELRNKILYSIQLMLLTYMVVTYVTDYSRDIGLVFILWLISLGVLVISN